MLSKNVEGFRIKGIGKISILHVIFLSLTVIGLKKSCSRGQEQAASTKCEKGYIGLDKKPNSFELVAVFFMLLINCVTFPKPILIKNYKDECWGFLTLFRRDHQPLFIGQSLSVS